MKILSCVVLAFTAAFALEAADLNLMPQPAHLTRADGAVALGQCAQFVVNGGDSRVGHAVEHLRRQLSLRTGMRFVPDAKGACPTFAFTATAPGLATQTVGEDESYHLAAAGTRVELTAPTPLGIIHGVETILQLIAESPQGWTIPAVTIDDSPRFPWRGLMIDVSRHFIPLDVLERNIDGMAAVKLNTLHLHLSDDEGFRVEVRSFPRLHELASEGQYYTQEQIRGLIGYARDRGIRIVPEFDVPGHSTDWITAAPQLSSVPGSPAHVVHGMEDSVRPPLDPTLEETYTVLDTVFGEMAALFPDAYFHIGGDEVDSKYWDNNPRIQVWMQQHSIADAHALQAYFNVRLQKITARYGKHMMGWDEILDPRLPKETLVHSWRGQKSLAEAAHMGYAGILSAGWYLDLMFPASKHYAVDPMSGDSASLTPAEKQLILGGEAAQWAEYITPEVLDNRLWPRLGAIAERLWSPAEVTDVASMYRRLDVLSTELEWLDLRHRTNSVRMLRRIAGDAPLEAVETLAAVVEPVKEYQRGDTNPYSTVAPLNRMVDAVPPESNEGREFAAVAERASTDAAARAELRRCLIRWRDNDAALRPYFAQSALLEDVAPLSQQLNALSTAGLEALDAVDNHRPVTAEQRTAQLAAVDAAAKPHAELFLVIAPAVRQMVAAEPVSTERPKHSHHKHGNSL